MKMHPFVFVIMLMVLFSSSSVYAFEYYDDFERYEIGSDSSSEYTNMITDKNPVVFSSGLSKRLVSLKDPVHAIVEVIPDSPKNPEIVRVDPSKLRTGDCIDCVMQFVNKGSMDLSKDSWSEQRFSLNPDALPSGEKGLTNLWLQYDQYIPKNYHHRDTSPASGSGYGDGRKVLALFADGYSLQGGVAYPTFIIGATNYKSDKDDIDYTDVGFIDAKFQTPVPGSSDRFRYTGIGVQVQKKLIDPSIDLGHWQRRTLHLRMPTAEGTNDGVIEFWVQRLAETAFPMAPEKLLEKFDGSFYGGSRNYLNKGYLLGYSNAGYNYDVTFLLDNLILSNDIQSIDSSAIEVDMDRKFPPNPPSIQIE